MIGIAVLALATAEPATAPLDPVLDRPYRLTVSEERSVSGRLRHFVAERRVVFHRDNGLLVADVTLVAMNQDIGGEAGRRFDAVAAALRRRPVRFRLATDGSLVGIDDEAAVWAAMAAAMDMSTGRRTNDSAAVAALPDDARRATIASIIMPIVAGADAVRTPGSRAVVLPSRPVAAGAPLRGRETVTQGDDGLLHIATHADASTGDAAVSIDRERALDAASGLVLHEEETQTTRLGTATQVTRTVTELRPG